ncbi:MAG: MBL fold metallo-hydrolase [Candidatus Thermoplasmatota archaeon]|jgi:glyoxylase-like metal-dependent hydrolase (beta-lactamase superfamily II)|nr:MBL fold metallo-hydrolase [Candidatus Sysuiplasma jiujiangense]MBX8640344.1 MBL fold metallo-hydrolase [Candidatus Sysuiplasma jiujiangense]MBX8642402.1 MBL fold metallo-hydrolase [Candidatus Sysuiplasma jiujiangense]MCL4317337.1 MBL fold metallo-hydrolase [Candidatus Thermoplasmatota archaeon]MCL5254073.1 MBL fold metallo-hydrolase [Candidatus Thermoplasmatota archaeon]
MQKVADGIYYLSTVGVPPTTSIYLVENDGEWAIFEPGPNSGAQAITEALGANGISPSEVKYLIVSHIHLDHAGASASLLGAYPQSKLIVYRGAARHLTDPSKLIASSSSILGPLFEAWGGMPSVPAGRIIEAADGQVFKIGDMPLRILYTPGHSPYHLSVWAEETGALFTGDAVGMYVREKNSLWPASPLPSFRLDMEMDTLRKFESLGPDVLLIPHFEPVPDPEHFIGMNVETYSDWHELLGNLKESDSQDTAAETILRSVKNYDWVRDNTLDWHMFNMHVSGFLQYERTAKQPPSDASGTSR